MRRAEKVSVALDGKLLAAAKEAAAAEGLSLSGLLTQVLKAHLAQQKRFANMSAYIEEYAADMRINEARMQSLREEMRAPLKPVQRAKRGRAA